MRFENSFAVRAPIDDVWAALLDIERVAPCMPGAEVLERSSEDAYKVGIRVRVGPISMTYRGDVEITERDESRHAATMNASARETKGHGTADAQIQMALEAENGGTRATLETDVQLKGRVAAMGQGVIGDVAAKLIETFAGNLAAMLEPSEPSPSAVDGPEPPSAPAPQGDTLPVGRIAAGVIAGRLANPRTLALTTVAFALVFLAIGFAIGRAV
ncbi:MAG: SRPBCC family protein [Solirubrobacteraceae bacterium]